LLTPLSFTRGDGAIAVIDPVTTKRLPTEYKFEGHPEGFQLETKGPRIFVNVADTKNIQRCGQQSTPYLHFETRHVREMLEIVRDQGHTLGYRM
jgi:hypothetical protein